MKRGMPRAGAFARIGHAVGRIARAVLVQREDEHAIQPLVGHGHEVSRRIDHVVVRQQGCSLRCGPGWPGMEMRCATGPRAPSSATGNTASVPLRWLDTIRKRPDGASARCTGLRPWQSCWCQGSARLDAGRDAAR